MNQKKSVVGIVKRLLARTVTGIERVKQIETLWRQRMIYVDGQPVVAVVVAAAAAAVVVVAAAAVGY